MNVVHQTFRRVNAVGAALGLLVASLLPILSQSVAYAAPTGGQVTTRSIKLSSSATSATGVSYDVKFNLYSDYSSTPIKGIIVDFCNATGGSPIVGDTNCAAPNAPFTVGASPSVTVVGGITGSWTAASLNSGRTLKLTKAAGDALAANTTVEFAITGVTNPGGSVGTFYGRVVTYTSDSGDIASYAAGSEGSTDAKDYGGFALSTSQSLNVVAKVQESLTFCVFTSGANCAGATGSTVALGDANGVLSNYATGYTNTAKFDVASNAQSGVVVRMKGTNLCRVASPCADTDTANVIVPQTAAACAVADSSATGTEQFGMRISAAGAGVTAATDYGCDATHHALNTANTTSTYGDQIASTAAPGDEVSSTMEFRAKAATTTEAGIYTTSLNFIATGTY